MTLVLRPFYSRAFGEQYAIIPLSMLDEKGLQDRDPESWIIAHTDGIDPRRITRFDTRIVAERYLASVTKDDNASTG